MGIYGRLFTSFLKIGGFTIGGGYAMIPLMEREVIEKNHWIDRDEFAEIIAIAQSIPGIFAVDMATYIGYKVAGLKGALVSILGNILPSLVIILAIAVFFREYKDIPTVEHIFKGIRPAVVALIAAPAFNMARSLKIGWNNFWIPLASALLISFMGVSPIYIILAAVTGGFIYGRIRKGGKE